MKDIKPEKKAEKVNIFAILKPYLWLVLSLTLFTIAGNAISLAIPKLISGGIDNFSKGSFDMHRLVVDFTFVSFLVFIFTYLQGIFQTYVAEKAAKDIRTDLVGKISRMSYTTLEKETPSKLLTNMTSDIDAVKLFISMGVVTVISSVILIIGAAGLLISINWKLALAVLALLPLIGLVFFFVFKKLGPLFKSSQEIMDRINNIISQSIVGAALVRVLNSNDSEVVKFNKENTNARETGMGVLKLFSIIIPTVGIIANLASLVILSLGGHFVILGSMSLGDFTAFNSYVIILIFPIIMLGFISNVISRASVSYARIREVFDLEDDKDTGTITDALRGDLEVKDATLEYGEKCVLNHVSFSIKAGTKTAIIGPTAAGKTQLIYTLIGLIKPDTGKVLYDGKPIEEYSKNNLHAQVALVFQDSVMFQMSVRENIAFSNTVREEDIKKAIDTAELGDFINSLPKGLDTSVSERGTSLSGGQKQRIMLARALAINPRVLFLDDFTARVDNATEKKILANVEKNYPGITLVSVTQKIRSVEHFDKIILLMEGEVLAEGTHEELSKSSPEYMQIRESQKSTETYE